MSYLITTSEMEQTYQYLSGRILLWQNGLLQQIMIVSHDTSLRINSLHVWTIHFPLFFCFRAGMIDIDREKGKIQEEYIVRGQQEQGKVAAGYWV